jgi:hypothetical protein
MQFYFGPNHFNTLREYSRQYLAMKRDYNLELEKLVPLGWGSVRMA